MTRIRVIVVDDSLTVRRHLIDVLCADPGIEVVGEAEDGKQGIELCQQLRPDVITLDMMMPVMTGVAATEYIMAYCPTPILIVSASTNRGELFKTYDALEAGALDVLDKPGEQADGGAWERRFVSTVKLLSRIKVITHPRGRLGALGRVTSSPPLGAMPAASGRRVARVVAIGVSTGGPGALVRTLRALPASFPAPALLVIHIGATFAPAFADWLGGQIQLPVSYAVDGEPLFAARGRVVIAPPDRHLVIRQSKLALIDDAERNFCKPSVDVLFESVADTCGPDAAAVLLTGMGRDGAAGMLAVRRAGGATIAQDEATSVVYGMPKEAVALGGAERVLPLDEIGAAVLELVTRGGG